MKYFFATTIMISVAFLALNSWFQTRPPAPLPAYSPSVNEAFLTQKPPRETAFADIGLETNTAVANISLGDVLGGGPRKDGIPAIDRPVWETVRGASDWLEDDSLGVLVTSGNQSRFYPYDVLYWHEIVNDRLNNQNISVTFCPLCGSAVVFDRGEDSFGVSGKLWESNLLMYDRATETLWSQITGEAVVGDRTGQTLRRIDSDVMEFSQIEASFADAQVLSKQTGHRRSYGRNPYGTYEEDTNFYFPVTETDETHHPKELFVLTNVGDATVGFHRKNLLAAGIATIEVEGKQLTAVANADQTIQIRDDAGASYPSYVAMWFSWVTHNDRPRVVWGG